MEFGKVEYICVSPKNGKEPMASTLTLTLIGQGDEDILLAKGIRELRLRRILRLTSEACEQGCMLGYDDLSALLLTSLATLKRDISYLEMNGAKVFLKGRRTVLPSLSVPGDGESKLTADVGVLD